MASEACVRPESLERHTTRTEARALFRCSSYIRLLFAYGMLPNIPFWVASRYLHVGSRGTFNVEYLAIGILALVVPKRIALAGLVTTLLFDVIHSSEYFYYFSQHDLLVSAKYLLLVPVGRVAWVSAGFLLFALFVGWAIIAISPQRNRVARPTIALVFAVIIVTTVTSDVVNGTLLHRRFRKDSQRSVKLAEAPALTLLKHVYEICNRSDMTVVPQSVNSATGVLFPSLSATNGAAIPIALRPNIVLVLVESYGLINNSRAMAALESPYLRPEITARYQLTFGSVPFSGSTVPAEIRELCGMGSEMGRMPQRLNVPVECLPKLARDHGYRTTAIHGFSGAMFDRRNWYPELGFERSFFLEDVANLPGIHMCPGSFPGACDADLAALTRKLLLSAAQGTPQFIYWVTLNSHLPLPRHSDYASGVNCASVGISDADVCLWTGLIHRVNESVAEIASDPALPPTEFIVVGDHAPPFYSLYRTLMYSQSQVPFVRLTPRSIQDSAVKRH